MKKFILAVTIIATLIFTAATCAAADVWVDNLHKGNVDLYVIEDTISASADQKFFTVTVKSVKKGKLDQIVNWKFSKRKTDEWHYETVTRNAKDAVLTAPNGIFEFCMKQIGWAYRVDGDKYY